MGIAEARSFYLSRTRLWRVSPQNVRSAGRSQYHTGDKKDGKLGLHVLPLIPGGAMTVERYLRLIAGLFVLLSTLLGVFYHPYWFFFTGFVALNLMQSAFSNWCPMMTILRKLGIRDEGK